MGGAGVLRFVEQDVGDAAIELPQHPFGRVLPREQVGRDFDEIVEVETGAGALALREIGEQHVCEAQHGGGAFEQAACVDRGGNLLDADDFRAFGNVLGLEQVHDGRREFRGFGGVGVGFAAFALLREGDGGPGIEAR